MKKITSDFSGATKALKLKLRTHMDSGLLYDVYQNQGKGPISLGITSFNRFYKFPLMKKFLLNFSQEL